MGQAALQIARRGWPVFPCRERDIAWTNAAGKGGLFKAKAPYTGKGLKDATVQTDRLVAWWTEHPEAMIGVPMGDNGCFALDFDPRVEDIVDGQTGEITGTREWTLEELKGALEEQIGVALPPSLISRTPSGGVHVWYRQPDDGGAPIRNRGNLPDHVDVRGQGGYVIAPPSVIVEAKLSGATEGEYRWIGKRGDWRDDSSLAAAPPELITVLRAPKAKANVDRAPATGSTGAQPSDEHRLYTAACALVTEHQKGSTSWLQRQLRLGYYSAARLIERMEADGIVAAPDHLGRRQVLKAAGSMPTPPAWPSAGEQVDAAIRKYVLAALDSECDLIRRSPSGRRNAQLNESAFKVATLVAAGALDATIARSSIEAAARDNPGNDDARQLEATIDSGWTAGIEQPRDFTEVASAIRTRAERAPPPRGRPAPPPAAEGQNSAPFRTGRVEGLSGLSEGERARFKAVSVAWFDRRLEYCECTRDAVTRLAFSAGRRIAAGLLDEGKVKEALWAHYETIADITHGDIDRAIDDGFNRGFDVAALQMTEKCVAYPMTDFGIAERFRDRYGADYRFTTAKGWLGWDKRRWKVLDQDEKTLPAEVIAAVFDTIRAIQDEARHVEDSGVRLQLVRQGKQERLDIDTEDAHALDCWVEVGKTFKRRSTLIRKWGRDSETVGKPASVALLARRWLTVPIERFDHDKLAVNVLNGTLRFRTEALPDGSKAASVELAAHSRDDMQTKLSPVTYDPSAPCALYDEMFAWAQPDASMRRYLHQIGGYSLTGDAGEQKLWFWYGRGRNGKGVTIETWCHVAGDYSGTIPIGSFLDQGIKKRGDQASPDLAKLAGVRMLRSSEPGRNEKLDSALIKLVTGGEPLPVRMLHRGFFDLDIAFKLIISGNSKFDIPDTDDGIWGRMKLVPWLRHIDKPEPGVENWPKRDPHLVDKIKAKEASGVLNRLVAGLLDYLTNGLVEPKSVTEATDEYRDASDPIARFMRHCTERADGERIQSSKLHEVFVAWAKAVGEREWTNKGFSNAMTEKGYRKKQSDGMWWLDLRLTRQVGDFVDEHGKPRTMTDDDYEPPLRERDPVPGYDDHDDHDDMPP